MNNVNISTQIYAKRFVINLLLDFKVRLIFGVDGITEDKNDVYYLQEFKERLKDLDCFSKEDKVKIISYFESLFAEYNRYNFKLSTRVQNGINRKYNCIRIK